MTNAEYQRQWCLNNPDKVKAKNKRRWLKVKSDPALYERRMAYLREYRRRPYVQEKICRYRYSKVCDRLLQAVTDAERNARYDDGVDDMLFSLSYAEDRGGVPNDEF